MEVEGRDSQSLYFCFDVLRHLIFGLEFYLHLAVVDLELLEVVGVDWLAMPTENRAVVAVRAHDGVDHHLILLDLCSERLVFLLQPEKALGLRPIASKSAAPPADLVLHHSRHVDRYEAVPHREPYLFGQLGELMADTGVP